MSAKSKEAAVPKEAEASEDAQGVGAYARELPPVQQVRLECLRIAVEARAVKTSRDDLIKSARSLEDYVWEALAEAEEDG